MQRFLSDKKAIALTMSAIAFIVIDRVFKALSIQGFFDSPLSLIQNILALDFEPNYYIAFSLPLSGIGLNILIIAIIIMLVYYLLQADAKEGDRLKAFLLFMVIVGAISNLIDRLLYGYVIDYIYLRYFTVFNLADCLIVVGTIALAISMFKKADH